MIKKDLSIEFLGVKFENPFCLSSSPVGNCYDMCKKAYEVGWGGVVFKTIGPKSYFIDEVSPRFVDEVRFWTDGFKDNTAPTYFIGFLTHVIAVTDR